MQRYIARRIIQMAIVIFFFSMLVFAIIRLIPGDPSTMMFPIDEMTPEAVAQVRREMGLDKPIPVQYLAWLREIARGNFGVSWRSRQPALTMIAERLPATLALAGAAILIATLVTVPLGIASGIRPHSWIDNLATAFSLMGIAMPSFWLGLMLILLFAVNWRVLPASGYTPLSEDFAEGLRRLIMPALTLGVSYAAPLTRFLRTGLLDVMSADYIRTARSKGLRERRVVLRHALKNALLTVVTVLGMQIGALIGGAIVTESVFAWPGIGRLLLDAIVKRDYGVLQAVILFVCAAYMVINLLVDILYAYLDPRIRYS
jgi:peptide/nickel transport system permease protein